MLKSGSFDLRAYVQKLSCDLGYAILTATIVEEELEFLLLAHMRLDDAGIAEWFGDYKTYSSFAGKISGAHKRGLIDEDTRSELSVIKDIRNEFAHTRQRLDFNAPSIRALAANFREVVPGFDVRQLFDERVERVVTAIQGKSERIIFDEARA